jgi:hypothetical protein
MVHMGIPRKRDQRVTSSRPRVVLGGDDKGVCQVVLDERETEVHIRVLVCCRVRGDDAPRRREYLDCPVRVWLTPRLGERAVIDVDTDEELPLYTPPYETTCLCQITVTGRRTVAAATEHPPASQGPPGKAPRDVAAGTGGRQKAPGRGISSADPPLVAHAGAPSAARSRTPSRAAVTRARCLCRRTGQSPPSRSWPLRPTRRRSSEPLVCRSASVQPPPGQQAGVKTGQDRPGAPTIRSSRVTSAHRSSSASAT